MGGICHKRVYFMKRIFFPLLFLSMIVNVQSVFTSDKYLTVINATQNFKGKISVKVFGGKTQPHIALSDSELIFSSMLEQGTRDTLEVEHGWYLYDLQINYFIYDNLSMTLEANLRPLKLPLRNREVKIYAYDNYELGIDKGDGEIIPLSVKLSTSVPEEA